MDWRPPGCSEAQTEHGIMASDFGADSLIRNCIIYAPLGLLWLWRLKTTFCVALSMTLGALISFFGYVPPRQDLKKNESVNPFSLSLFITPSNQSQSKPGGCLFPFPHTGLPFLEVSIHIYAKFQVTVRSLRIWENQCSLSNEGISLTIWHSKSKLRNCDKQ